MDNKDLVAGNSRGTKAGGTAAIGIAMKLARYATGRFKTISMWDSFHGASLDAISIGGEALFREQVGPLLPGCIHVPPYSSEGIGKDSAGMGQISVLTFTYDDPAEDRDWALEVFRSIRHQDEA